MSSVWTISYTQPGRYHWLLQFYLRAEGLALSWVGTGRLIFSLNYGEPEFQAVLDRFVLAAKKMSEDGWWWQNPKLTRRSIRLQILRETLGWPEKTSDEELAQDHLCPLQDLAQSVLLTVSVEELYSRCRHREKDL